MSFFPKNFDFFKLFEDQVIGLDKSVKIFRDLEENNDIKKRAREIKEVEQKADNITHEIIDTLNKTFITPIDREDIALLASNIDDAIDALEKAMNRLSVYEINPVPIEVFQYIDLIEKISSEVTKAVNLLSNPKKKESVLKHCEIINLI